jgi:hypothetical protein
LLRGGLLDGADFGNRIERIHRRLVGELTGTSNIMPIGARRKGRMQVAAGWSGRIGLWYGGCCCLPRRRKRAAWIRRRGVEAIRRHARRRIVIVASYFLVIVASSISSGYM